MTAFVPVKEGKVREIYDLKENLLMVATDRISAFDVILNNRIADKGRVLTQMSKFWFDFTRDVIPNDLLSVDTKDMPEFFRNESFEGRSTLCRKLEMIPIECIVRGYITGSGWENYKKDGTICGRKLPEGLKECEKLPEPLYTPSTKAELGEHDENISFEQSIGVLEKAFPGRGEALAVKIRDATLAVYRKCADYALSRGIIIADTKFEFGLDREGNVVLADEVLTPDSSRFWRLRGYEAGKPQASFDKQYVRDWLRANPDNQNTLPEEVVERTSALYKEAYTMLTGREL
ncbi:phosphoribosylaminoimidazolesuccinocarboxamide synthase [Oribacterium sp. oral taxon 102]|uniref:phosphoribosylaminoimidazolesuccinocarboxamide synthase n=1 Tax=Oribacterium sp. oral taxon 102 TaxID=671214 RepID=UPI0015B95745|nr:phosphoribosylaminoimidazolesuccinocarboxamide synthase [Oribacterium sp. oral taxon 102]NWO20998.1 phosphoribosylaminoimidazolesuccinocarboxamide synthase [Oribacterium sp. oral taxon 102]